jgi:hypothetical protein
MANDDDSRRNRERPEDNPFIAFRRFADSQVSSLLNTVFTLPATIANYNNVHQAREACLFRKADKAQCDKLQETEDEIAGLRHEGRELYRVGDLQQVLKKSEELMQLDRYADELRKNIVGQIEEGDDSKELVHRVANKKGQEWGWDWSWGFPKPFDDDGDASHLTPAERNLDQAMSYLRRVETESKKLFGDDAWDDIVGTALGAVESNPMLRGLMGDKEWYEVQRLFNSTRPYSPQALESDSRMQQAGVDWREAYEDLCAQAEENRAKKREIRSRAMKSYRRRAPSAGEDQDDEPSYEYSHDHEDQHDDPPTPKTKQDRAFGDWRSLVEDQDDCDIQKYLEEQRLNGRRLSLREQADHGLHPWCSQVPEQSASDKSDIAKFLSEEQRKNGRYVGMRELGSTSDDWCDPAEDQSASDKRDIQKFLSEQEQVNGRYLGLREPFETPETELDVYEQLLEKPKGSESTYVTKTIPTSNDEKPSILSTLTTTERTVAPDGSVTTKMVLKKRFVDGREETTETVHMQRGQETGPCNTGRDVHVSNPGKNSESETKEKTKGGWFWSS